MQKIFIEVYLIYKVPGVQQSDSVMHTYIYIYIFQIIVHYRLYKILWSLESYRVFKCVCVLCVVGVGGGINLDSLYRKQNYSYQRGKAGERNKLGIWD